MTPDGQIAMSTEESKHEEAGRYEVAMFLNGLCGLAFGKTMQIFFHYVTGLPPVPDLDLVFLLMPAVSGSWYTYLDSMAYKRETANKTKKMEPILQEVVIYPERSTIVINERVIAESRDNIKLVHPDDENESIILTPAVQEVLLAQARDNEEMQIVQRGTGISNIEYGTFRRIAQELGLIEVRGNLTYLTKAGFNLLNY